MNRISFIKKCLLVSAIIALLYAVFMTDIAKVHTGIALLAGRYLDQQQQRLEDLSQPPQPPAELEGAKYEIALPPSDGLALVMIPYLEGKLEIPPELKPWLDGLEAGWDDKADELRPLSFAERRRDLDRMFSFDHDRDQGYEEHQWLRAHFIREMNERGVYFQLETTR